MQINENTEARRWYREPWVWLLIALPMSAVIGGMITIYLAIASSDGLVVDDYYARGKAINLDLARDRAAARYQLDATLTIDAQNGPVTLTLASGSKQRPAHIRMLLLHPTRAGQDQHVRLEPRSDGSYYGTISAVVPGNWHVQLEADDWRLSGRVLLPRAAPFRLEPQRLTDSGRLAGE